jgi:hypothetical protein
MHCPEKCRTWDGLSGPPARGYRGDFPPPPPHNSPSLHQYRPDCNVPWCDDRLKKRQLASLLTLTESCSWSGLPPRDLCTGTLTMAGRIPLIQRLTWVSCVLIMVSHTVHQIHRLTTRNDRPLVFNAWFPVDTTQTPVFQLIYISQVRSEEKNGQLVTATSGPRGCVGCCNRYNNVAISAQQTAHFKRKLLQRRIDNYLVSAPLSVSIVAKF